METNNKGVRISLNSLGSLFEHSYKEYKERFFVLTEIVLLPVLIMLLGYALIFIGSIFSLLGMLVLVVGWVTLIFSTLALIFSVHNNTGVDASYQAITKYFWPYIWLSILAFVTFVGGAIMLILPGIWLAIAFSLRAYVLVLENKKGMDGLRQSKKYIDGYWWAFLGRTIIIMIVLWIVTLILSILFSVMGSVGATMASLVSMIFIVPLSTIFYYKIYQNLKTLKPELHETQSSGQGFFKVAAIVGAIGSLIFASIIIVLIVYVIHNPGVIKAQMLQNGYNVQYPSSNQ